MLQWQPQDDFGPSPLKPEQLVPAKQVQCGAVRSPRNATAKIFTLNALGTKNKHRYFEDQLDHLGIHIAMFQGTKSAEGLCESSRFLRLSTASERHWGVAIWFSTILNPKPYRSLKGTL